MQTTRFSRSERRSLRKLARGDGCPRQRIPPRHIQKFASLGLLAAGGDLFGLTLKGQVEVLRQHFRFFQPKVEPALKVARTAPPDEEIYRLKLPPLGVQYGAAERVEAENADDFSLPAA
jgi:hypothetical protein